jgi:D-arabinose 1-dehydrogenase-like Zn-dependent alcohol dehydrogenase
LIVLGAGGVGTHVMQLANAVDPTVTLAMVVRSNASAVSELGQVRFLRASMVARAKFVTQWDSPMQSLTSAGRLKLRP